MVEIALIVQTGVATVFDTTIEDQPDGFFRDRPWTRADDPKTAVRECPKPNKRFVVARNIDGKLLISTVRKDICAASPTPERSRQIVRTRQR